MKPIHIRFGGYQPPTAVQRRFATDEDDDVVVTLRPAEDDIMRPTHAERALFGEAVVPVVEEQRRIFGHQLFRCLRS
jgi:hypothetical protein